MMNRSRTKDRFIRMGARIGSGTLAGVLLMWAALSFLNGRVSTAVWWTSIAGGWLLVDRAALSSKQRSGLVLGSAVFGAVFVAVGAWLEWTVRNPLYEGVQADFRVPPGIELEWGFQFLDLPMVAVAIAGTALIARYRRQFVAAPVALGTGVICFALAVGNTYLTTAGPFVLTWGYYVTLGGCVLFIFSGLLQFSLLNEISGLSE